MDFRPIIIEYRNFWKTGSDYPVYVEISGTPGIYIKNPKDQSNMTEFLESIGIGPSPSLTNLKFIEQPREVGLFTLHRVENDGTITELNHITFAVVESGKTTSKIRSKLETGSAYQLELVIKRETKEFHYHLNPRFLESNAVAA